MSLLTAIDRLTAHERAVVAIAVLLDGRDAPALLEVDQQRGSELVAAARALSGLAPEVRMPLCGTLLREALGEGSW